MHNTTRKRKQRKQRKHFRSKSKKQLKYRSQRAGTLSVNLNGDRVPENGKRYNVSQVELYDGTNKPKLIYHGQAKAFLPVQTNICRYQKNCAQPQATYVMDGNGILIEYDPNGTFTRYEGNFNNNNKQGSGVIELSNGTKYDGEWANDTMSGKGKIKFSNSFSFYNHYEGDFENGTMHGQGKMTMENGDVYEGDWINGTMHGQGKLTFHNGYYYDGNFIDGKMQEDGKMFDKDGHEVIIDDDEEDKEDE